MSQLDKAINAYRPDLAAKKLEGQVSAEKFASPTCYQIKVPIAQFRNAPNKSAENSTQAVLGALLDVYEIKDGFAWGQLVNDDYVGYVALEDIGEAIVEHTHMVCVMRTNAYAGPKVQFQINAQLTFGAKLLPDFSRRENGYVWCNNFGFIYESHIIELAKFKNSPIYSDPLDVALQLLGTPYVWGGNTPYGIDCSGLVQFSFAACGIDMPRDARLQENCGQAISFDENLVGLRRGDLVFWKGHVAIMLDSENIIHATSFTMSVSIEPLKTAKARIDNIGIPIRAIKRVY